MNNAPDKFLLTPEHEGKPRLHSVTHALDLAMPTELLAAYLASAGAFVDVMKLGWGLGYIDPQLSQRAQLCRRHGVILSAGGTLLEIAADQHRISEFADWAAGHGIGAVEVSNGLGLLTLEEKSAIIASLCDRFIVLAETGSKDERAVADPRNWAEEMTSDLESGATWAIAEGRESGTVGLYYQDGSVRTGLLDAMAEAAARQHRPGVVAYVVTGRYRHVNFIWRPQPVTVFVDEVVPPHPPKLAEMARQAAAFDEDLPPLTIVQRLTSIPQLARSVKAGSYLLPCQGAADEVLPGGPVQFLDRGPSYRPDWTLIGCRRSEQIFAQFYGHRPDLIDFCPEQSGAGAPPGARRLTKCCLLERGIEARGRVAVVPWGARLDEVRSALALIAAHEEDSVA